MKNNIPRIKPTKKKYLCSYQECGKVYASNQRLKIHTRQIHARDYPLFQCPYCDKISREKSNLVVHIRTHSGERPYKCSYCPRTFSSCGNKNDHQRRHTQQTQLQTHILQSEYRSHKCSFCSARFYRLTEKKIHISKHHQPDPNAESFRQNYIQEEENKEQNKKIIHEQEGKIEFPKQIIKMEESGPSRVAEHQLQSTSILNMKKDGQVILQSQKCGLKLMSKYQQCSTSYYMNYNEREISEIIQVGDVQIPQRCHIISEFDGVGCGDQLDYHDFRCMDSSTLNAHIFQDIQQRQQSLNQTDDTKQNEGQKEGDNNIDLFDVIGGINRRQKAVTSLKDLIFEKLIETTCFSQTQAFEIL